MVGEWAAPLNVLHFRTDGDVERFHSRVNQAISVPLAGKMSYGMYQRRGHKKPVVVVDHIPRRIISTHIERMED
jgi:hypothetical protein